MNKPVFFRVAGVAAIVLSASVAAGLPAQAATDGGGSTRGTCTQSSNVRLSVNSGKNNKLHVKAQITHGKRGDRLEYVIADNGNKAKVGHKNTGKQGKTTVTALIPNVQGNDTVVFTSTNTQTAEVCTAQVIFKG